MNESRDPLRDLEKKVRDLEGRADLTDYTIKITFDGMKEDIAELKVREKEYVRIDNFSFYEKAFWIVATSTVSMLIGAIFYVITNRGGGS
jgi:hypothetical protein